MQSRWPIPTPRKYTALRVEIDYRKIRAFLSASLSFIRSFIQSRDLAAVKNASTIILKILQSRAIPEIDYISSRISNDLRPAVVSIVLELLNVDSEQEHSHLLLSQWIWERGKWKSAIELEFKRIVSVKAS